MARDDSHGSIKRITATRSFELHDQLFEWRDLAFQQIANRSNRIHESTLIHQFSKIWGPIARSERSPKRRPVLLSTRI
jgi:hypothetical protein